MTPPVYVLVGGNSRRFGRDKATFPVDGEPWALHVGRRLAESDAAITLVGELGDPGPVEAVRRIPDAPACRGPLAGVLAALRDRRDGLLTLAACDLVRPEPEWLAPLIDAHGQNPDLDVAAFTADGRWQPFPSVIACRWLLTLERSVAKGVQAMHAALAASNTMEVAWPLADTKRLTVNTPEELDSLTNPQES